MAALNYGHKGVAFVCNTSAGDQTISLSGGPSKTPKYVIILMSRATALDTISNNAYIGFGATDGTNTFCVCAMGEHNVLATNADTGVRSDNAAIVQITSTASEAKEARATFVSFGTDQITINWASGNVPTSAYRGYAIFGYGDDMQAVVTTITSSSSAGGDASSTALGATPDYVVCASVAQAIGAEQGFNEEMLCVGFSGRAPSITNGCSFNFGEDRQSNTAAANLGRNDACLGSGTLTAGTSAEVARLSVFSYDTNGITVRNALAGVALVGIYVLVRIGGRQAWAGAPTLNADTSGSMGITDPGFRPGFMLVSATRCAVSGTIVASGQLCLGFATPTEHGCVSMNLRNNLGTSSTQTLASTANVIDVLSNTTNHDWVADFTSFDPTGATLNVGTVAAADRVTALLFVEAAPVEVSPTGLASESAFGSATLTAGAVTLSPTGLASASAFGSATLTAGAVTLSPTGLASASAFGTATLTATITLSPTGLASESAFGSATLTAGTATVSPTGLASESAFGTATLNAGAVTVSPAGLASESAFGTATLNAGAVTLSPAGLASESAFGSPTLTATATLSPTGLASASAFGLPALTTTVTISPTGLASESGFGLPFIATGNNVLPVGLASESAFGLPALTVGGVTVSPSGLASASAFGLPALTATVTLSPSGLASASAFGNPTLSITDSILPVGLASESAFGLPVLSPGVATVSPVGLASESAFGTPSVDFAATGDFVFPVGLASESVFGIPFLRGGALPLLMKPRIREAIRARVALATFIEALYPMASTDGKVLEQGLQVQPRSIELDELTTGSGIDRTFGGALVGDQTRWRWQLTLRFDQAVLDELFRDSLERDPICVPRLPNESASRQANVFLVDCQYVHPPRGNPSNGSVIKYRLEARLTPR